MSVSDNAKPLILEYCALRAQNNANTARMKELDAEVRPMLVDEGANVIGDYLVELKVNAGRKTLDKKALVASGVDITPFEKVGAPFTSLHIKELG